MYEGESQFYYAQVEVYLKVERKLMKSLNSLHTEVGPIIHF